MHTSQHIVIKYNANNANNIYCQLLFVFVLLSNTIKDGANNNLPQKRQFKHKYTDIFSLHALK